MAPKRSNKRRRELEDEPGQAESGAPTMPTATQTWVPYPELWLEHGDIVLVCDKIGFRVSKCVLAANSPMFAEKVKAAAAHGEISEGLPVVYLEDSAEDMYHVLKVLHLRLDVHRAEFGALPAFLKLSSKYGFAHLRADTVNALTTLFPSTPMSFRSDLKHLPKDIDPTLAVELAKEYDIPAILPAACYLSALLPAKNIMNPTFSSAGHPARFSCIMFRDELMNVVDKMLRDSDIAYIWEDYSHEDYCSEDECRESRLAHALRFETEVRRLEGNIFDESLFLPTDAALTSESIQRKLTRHWCNVQQKIWDHLPSLCGFNDWAAVKAAQEASLKTTN